MISAVTGVTVLTGRFKDSVVPVAHAIPLHTSVSLPSASFKLENAAGPAMTSGAALCAVVTPATPDAASQLMATMNSGKSLGSGVINGSDVRLRSDASTSASILATLSRGTSVTVLAENGSWYAVSYNGTAGYVAQQYVTMGDSLPADTGSADNTDDSTGSASTVPSGTYGSSAVSIAYQYMGVPYVYGGASPSGFDCSGFTMYVYAQLGVSLPHGATPQLNYGTYVSRSELQPGDLVFFSDGSYPASHVGIYVGGDEFIHASSSSSNGYCVCVSSLNSNYYSRNFVGGRRF